jgi:integrase/recombinase XerD
MYIPELIRKEGLRRGLSPRTIRTYSNCVEKFFRTCHKEPFQVTKVDIQYFLDRLLEKSAPGNTLNVYLNALKFFYEEIMHRKLTVNIRYSKIPQKLPEFLIQEEVTRLFAAIANPKHQLMIKLLYATGMRVNELCHLKVKDFQFEQNYGWVRQGKGKKDRPFIVPQKLKEELLLYIHRDQLQGDGWLFPGHKNHYSPASVQAILHTSATVSKLTKKVHPHMLRHSFATHLIQNGYSVMDVQPLLGHQKLETTLVYLHLAAPRLLNIESPYDRLLQSFPQSL